MTRRTILLWRHGRTAWNLASRFQGHTDVPLDEVGMQQAGAAAEALAKRAPAVIASSDLTRATATAGELAALVGLPVLADPALREAHAGSWEGLTHGEILAGDEEAFARWRTDPSERPGGTGETRAEVGTRVATALRRHAGALEPGQTAVLVTHGGAARAAVGHLVGLESIHWQRMAVLANCCWAELEVDGADGWRLVAYNVAW